MKVLNRTVCLAVLVGTLSTAATAQDVPSPLATTDLFTHEIEILSDGTWRFVDPEVSIADINTDAQICDQLDNGRVTFCHPEGEWERTAVFLTNGVNEYAYTHSTGLSLSIAQEPNYGYGDDLDYWKDLTKPGIGDWLASAALKAVFGAEFEQNRVLVVDDVVFSEVIFNDEGFGASMSAELLVQNESLWIDITALRYLPEHEWEAMSAAFSEATTDIYSGITIEGRTLTEIIRRQEAE